MTRGVCLAVLASQCLSCKAILGIGFCSLCTERFDEARLLLHCRVEACARPEMKRGSDKFVEFDREGEGERQGERV